MQEQSIYEQVGGEATFAALVEAFYVGIEGDEVLRPMYPQELQAAKRHLTLFLCQYFGGPETYSNERGHPRLRMRHAPFVIGIDERDLWLKHMLGAMETTSIAEPAKTTIINYFLSTANFLMNVPTTVTVNLR